MSRSNPTDNSPNPSKCWFEWDGSNGTVRYFDKDQKENVDIGDDFVFILLDELAAVKGWHDHSDSGIYSNEVKDVRADVLVVKSFKGGILTEGIYKQIKDRVAAVGGNFVTNCYIAFKSGKNLEIGSIYFKGAALHAWVEFRKANRKEVYAKAVRIKGSVPGKKGKIEFKTPIFSLRDISEETEHQAVALDKELQEYLTGYFSRTRVDQAVAAGQQRSEEDFSQEQEPPKKSGTTQLQGRQRQRQPEHDPDLDVEDDDIPF